MLCATTQLTSSSTSRTVTSLTGSLWPRMTQPCLLQGAKHSAHSRCQQIPAPCKGTWTRRGPGLPPAIALDSPPTHLVSSAASWGCGRACSGLDSGASSPPGGSLSQSQAQSLGLSIHGAQAGVTQTFSYIFLLRLSHSPPTAPLDG